jgi:HAD superfamily hydrolase (TIGR01509 family)
MVKPLPHVHTPVWNRRAVLFDLDGVLVDTMAIHRDAFLIAIRGEGIQMDAEEHDATLAGLPTVVKLDRLGVLRSDAPAIVERKQAITRNLIENAVTPDLEKCHLLRDLAQDGYALGVYSNAIHATVTRVLQLADLVWPLAVILSNEHVTRPKPAPDGWIIAMYEIGAKPERTWIVEDAPPGIASAKASGANLIEVAGPLETVTAVRSVLLR